MERKNRYIKNTKLLTLVFKKLCYLELEPGAGAGSQNRSWRRAGVGFPLSKPGDFLFTIILQRIRINLGSVVEPVQS